MRIKAWYKVPTVKRIFLIVSPFLSEKCSCKLSSLHKKEKEILENALLSKCHINPKEDPHWSIEIIHEDDFLSSLENSPSKSTKASNRSFRNSENMELLATNLLKIPLYSLDPSSITSKRLGKIRDDDIIEIFI